MILETDFLSYPHAHHGYTITPLKLNLETTCKRRQNKDNDKHAQNEEHNHCKSTRIFSFTKPCANPEGGYRGSVPPPQLKTHKAIGFLSNTGPDPWKIIKLPSQHSILGHHRPPAKRHFNGVSLAGRWWPAFIGYWILSPLINNKKKKLSEGAQLTKLSWSAHENYCKTRVDINNYNSKPRPITKPQHKMRATTIYNWCILLRLTSGLVNPRTVMFTEAKPRWISFSRVD